MVVSSWNDPVVDYGDLPLIAQDEAAAINKAGGISGHPVSVVSCNDQFNPNIAESCARQAVSDGVQALVGGFTIYAYTMFPVLQAAGIPWLGNLGETSADLTSSYSFPGSPGPLLELAPSVLAGQQCQRTAFMGQTTTDTETIALIQDGIRSQGKQFVAFIQVPTTTTDYSAAVAQISSSNADCLVLGLPEAAILQFIPALTAAGEASKLKVFSTSGGELTPRVVSAFPSVTEGWQSVGYYDTSDSPQWQPYSNLMKSSGNLGKYLPNIFGSAQQRTYIAMLDFQEIVSKISGPITSASIYAQLNKSCDVTSDGLAPVMDFCKPNPIPALMRVFNTGFTFQVVKNGQFVLSTPGFHDLEQDYVTGSKAAS
jgi:ABC-type branched-subunit amino acid transport system substrate-binding protein